MILATPGNNRLALRAASEKVRREDTPHHVRKPLFIIFAPFMLTL
jgi:hypothetical protein